MTKSYEVWPGVAYPLGATYDGRGVNFAVTSHGATTISVCLFDASGVEVARLPLEDQTNHVFHGYVPGLEPGALYGFRAEGPWAPERGLRFNPHKLLVDPYARALHGQVDWSQPLVGHAMVDGAERPDERDSAAGVPRSVVVHDDFDWRGDVRPEVIWRKAIIYELHVKGFTKLHPQVPEALRGTYAGLGHPATIDYLLALGVTSVELLPVHASVSEGFLAERGLTNYWGYNTLGYFAPDQRFAASSVPGAQVREFKEMVRALHQAGIEVLLDVVFNHTAEGNHLGPTLSLRGLDNPTYYWLESSNPARYRDFTGCGNALAANNPVVVKLIMDSLRYWVSEMHVDGFRYDLATTLARNSDQGLWDERADLFVALHQDPVLSRVKHIAEPWDLGQGGYRAGEFPVMFAEWNDRYRQTLRRFWRGDPGQLADLGYRLSGSSDVFKASGRRPTASINYFGSHDGFTLADLVSHSKKHNEANLEGNRDGADENHSHNWGVEGPTDDAAVVAVRERASRNFIASLFLSVGTPMLVAGDESGRTQRGNNNAYCQDNELSWVDWQLDERRRALLEFTRACIALRRNEAVLQRRNFFLGATLEDSRFRDLVWFHPGGRELTHDDWADGELRTLGLFLGGDAIGARRPEGQRITGHTLLVYLNAQATPVDVTLPHPDWGRAWESVLETAQLPARRFVTDAGQPLAVPERSLLVLRLVT